MNKRLLTIACLTALLSFNALAAEEAKTLAAPAAPAADPAEPPDTTTIATVNDQQFPLGLFRLFYGERLRAARAENTPEFQNLAFNEFINIVVTAQDAKANCPVSRLLKADWPKTLDQLEERRAQARAVVGGADTGTLSGPGKKPSRP